MATTPIKSQRGRQRAVNEVNVLERQLVEIQRQRDEANRKFDGMRDMLAEQIAEISDAIHAFDAPAAAQGDLLGSGSEAAHV